MDRSQPPLPEAAIAAFARGDLAAAIQAIRKAGPIDLASARRAIEAHARELAVQQTHKPGRPGNAHASGQESNARAASRAHAPASMLGERPPTVGPGDAPGNLRWVLAVLFLLAAAALLGVF